MASLRILGQVRNTYLVAEGNDGMYLIDQHAAHERVLFEKVSREVADRTPQSQALLEPVAVELTPGQEELVGANTELLERYGFILEPFGERTYLLRTIPVVVRDSSPGKALLEVLDIMAYEGLLKERDDALAASIACHSAVRAGMVLSQHEMDELIRQLESCDSPHTCPHGRPTMIHLSSHHLEQEFGRR
jgi:DNA mismatch repair protein MutL